MVFFAFLAHLILFFVHGYECYESAHKLIKKNEVKTEIIYNTNTNLKLNDGRPDMDIIVNNKQSVLQQVQQSPELTVENPSKIHFPFF